MIRSGFATVDITPRLGLNMPGYYEERPAQGVTLPLMARAAVFRNDDTVTGFCALDLLHITRHMCEEIANKIKDYGKFSPDGILICGLHVHTGAPIEPENDKYAIADMKEVEKMCALSAEAIIKAYERAVECKVAFGKTFDNSLAFNRRFKMKDGSYKTWPGISNPALDIEAGPVDPEVDVLKVEDLNGGIIGIISGFGCHADSVGGYKYCSDFPGVLSEEIRRRYGENVVSVFLPAPSGDITHIDYRNVHPIREEHYVYMGKKLAEDVFFVVDSLKCTEVDSIDFKTADVMYKRHVPDDEEYKKALDVISAYERGEKLSDRGDDGFEKPTTGDDDMMELAFARDTVKLRESGLEYEPVRHHAVRIGDVCFFGYPAEIFAELALDFRKKCSHDNVFLVELSDGCVGYVGPDHAYDEGGYETRYSTYVVLDRGCGEQMNECLLELDKII